MTTNGSTALATTAPAAVIRADQPPRGARGLQSFLASDAAMARLKQVASKYLAPEELLRLALLSASRQPELLKCTQASILRALIDAATLGIAPGGTMGRGYLVPRRNKKTGNLEANFDPGWRGLADIAKRSGQVKRIEAHVVRKSDRFRVVLGLEPTIEHVPAIDADDRGPVVAAYAVADFGGGVVQFEVLSSLDLKRIRAVSQSNAGPWSTWDDEMARKSAVRRLCKYLPFDPILERAQEASDAANGADLGEIPAGEVGLEEALAQVGTGDDAPAPELPPAQAPAEKPARGKKAQAAPPAQVVDHGPTRGTDRIAWDPETQDAPPPEEDDLGGRM